MFSYMFPIILFHFVLVVLFSYSYLYWKGLQYRHLRERINPDSRTFSWETVNKQSVKIVAITTDAQLCISLLLVLRLRNNKLFLRAFQISVINVNFTAWGYHDGESSKFRLSRNLFFFLTDSTVDAHAPLLMLLSMWYSLNKTTLFETKLYT